MQDITGGSKGGDTGVIGRSVSATSARWSHSRLEADGDFFFEDDPGRIREELRPGWSDDAELARRSRLPCEELRPRDAQSAPPAGDASPNSWAGAPALEFIAAKGNACPFLIRRTVCASVCQRRVHAYPLMSPHCARFSLPEALACIPLKSPHCVRFSLPKALACTPCNS